jgi:DNA polymerase-4
MRQRKSLSVEETFIQDISDRHNLLKVLDVLYEDFLNRFERQDSNNKIKNIFLKVKFNNFKIKTIETISHDVKKEKYQQLLEKLLTREKSTLACSVSVCILNRRRMAQ